MLDQRVKTDSVASKMKDKNEVIQEFGKLVNMTAKDLKEWLKGDDSASAGWAKDDGNGESIGHDSGRQIVDILESNPEKNPEKYTDDNISHMRKVVSYWYVKRRPSDGESCLSLGEFIDAYETQLANDIWPRKKGQITKSLSMKLKKPSRTRRLRTGAMILSRSARQMAVVLKLRKRSNRKRKRKQKKKNREKNERRRMISLGRAKREKQMMALRR